MKNFIKIYGLMYFLLNITRIFGEDYNLILNPHWEKNTFTFKNSTLYSGKITKEYQYRKILNNNQIGYFTKGGFSYLLNIPISINLYNISNLKDNTYSKQDFILLENISFLTTYEKKLRKNKAEIGVGLIFPSRRKLIESLEKSNNLFYDFSKLYENDYLKNLNYLMLELGSGYKIIKDPLVIENKLKLYLPLTNKNIDEEYIIRYIQSGVFLINNNISLFGDLEFNLISKKEYFDENYIFDFGISYLVDSYSELKLGILNTYSNSSNNFGLILSYQKIFN